MNIAYGYTIEPFHRDHLVQITNLALDHFAKAATPGTWIVDIIPACECHDQSSIDQEDLKADIYSETSALMGSRGRLQTYSPVLERATARYSR